MWLKKKTFKTIVRVIKLFSVLNLLLGILIIVRTAKAYNYPIAELGNCQNQKECHLYCEIPQNQPACWSYRVYKTAVLGETTFDETLNQLGFSFPIAQLGNCSNLTECKNYCQDPTNLAACQSYSQNMRLTVKQKLLEKAQIELGCNNVEDCKTFCNQEQNKSLCAAFGRRWKIKTQTRQTILNQAQATLGCQTFTECKAMCDLEENKDICRSFAQKVGLKIRTTLKEKLGCITNEDCRKRCLENPNQCPGFPKLSSPDLNNLQRRLLPQRNILPLKPSIENPVEIKK